MIRPERACRLATAALGLLLLTSPPALAGEATVTAVSSWQARGEVLPTGVDEATFVGVLSGVLIVTDAANSVDSGQIACLGTMVIDTALLSQIGHGKCVITTPDAERLYGEFSCTGVYGEGCNGDFTLTGGSGEKEGISGGGPFLLKGLSSALLSDAAGNIVDRTVAGVALWPKFTYRLP